MRIFSLSFLLLFSSFRLVAQLPAAEKTALLDTLARRLHDRYVFPETADAMVAHLRTQQRAGAYDALTTGDALAARLTEDLRSVSHDLHIHVQYYNEVLPPEPAETGNAAAIPESELPGFKQWIKRENYGVTRLEVLPGNIGLVAFKFLIHPEYAGETYVAAMQYLAQTDALILDLRGCNGSVSPDAVPFLCSYFFDQSVHINSLYWRKGNRTEQFRTYAMVPGHKYLNKPVYVLTSGRTFSGAEEMAYDLQTQKRAILIGETTRGGANPGGSVRLSDHFDMFLPVGRAINPITGTNWEGTGVKPDTALPANRALHKAHLLALAHTVATATDPGWKAEQAHILADVQAHPPVFHPVPFRLDGFSDAKAVYVAGSFNAWGPQTTPMVRKGNAWVAEAESESQEVQYKFIVDGKWILDPANPEKRTQNGHENSYRKL